jgi:hypothetical protein
MTTPTDPPVYNPHAGTRIPPGTFDEKDARVRQLRGTPPYNCGGTCYWSSYHVIEAALAPTLAGLLGLEEADLWRDDQSPGGPPSIFLCPAAHAATVEESRRITLHYSGPQRAERERLARERALQAQKDAEAQKRAEEWYAAEAERKKREEQSTPEGRLKLLEAQLAKVLAGQGDKPS